MLGEAQRKADTLRAEGNRLEEQLGELTEKLKVMRKRSYADSGEAVSDLQPGSIQEGSGGGQDVWKAFLPTAVCS